MKKFLKSLALISSVAVFAMGLTACSSDSGDDNNGNGSGNGVGSSGTGTTLPKSVGTNELAGKTYYQTDKDDYHETMSFTDDTIKNNWSYSENLYGYKYSYNSERGIIYVKLNSVTVDGSTFNSVDELKKIFSDEEIKHIIGANAQDFFDAVKTYNYYIAANGNFIMADFFGDKISDSNGLVEFKFNDGNLSACFGKEHGSWWLDLPGVVNQCDVSIDENRRIIIGDNVKGSFVEIVNAKKTLKEICSSDPTYEGGLNEANGYIVISFSKLPDSCKFSVDKPYKFIFELNCEVYE